MSLFRKKTCPVCGGPLGVFALRVADGVKICSVCERMLRDRYGMTQQGAVLADGLWELDVAEAKRIIEQRRAEQAADRERYRGRYTSVLAVSGVFGVPTEGLTEGGAEAVALGGRCVAAGFCETGSFRQGDRVTVLGEEPLETAVLRLIPCTGAYPFEEELIAGIHRKTVEEGWNAWLVLDLPEGRVRPGDRIVL